MSAIPMTFSQKWNTTFSLEAEQRHISQAFYCDIATIAVVVGALAAVVGVVALSVLSGFVVSWEAAYAIGSIASGLIYYPALALARRCLNQSRQHYALADQAIRITTIFDGLNPEITCREGATLAHYWKECSIDYEALDKQPCTKLGQRIIQLDSERDAAITKTEYIFWKTLSEDKEKFEEVFLKSGTNAYSAIAELATWDKRTTEERLINLSQRPKVEDALLTFKQTEQTKFTYMAILRNRESEQKLERCFKQALNIQEAA